MSQVLFGASQAQAKPAVEPKRNAETNLRCERTAEEKTRCELSDAKAQCGQAAQSGAKTIPQRARRPPYANPRNLTSGESSMP